MKQLFHNPVFRLAIAALLLANTPARSKRGDAGGRDSNVDYWTCTMHPSVHAKDPGKCPICSMDLVPVIKKQNETEKRRNGETGTSPIRPFAGSPTREFVVPVERQQQIGVSFATVEMKPLSHSIRAVGRVVPETQRI